MKIEKTRRVEKTLSERKKEIKSTEGGGEKKKI